MINGRHLRYRGGFTYVAMLLAVAVVGVGLAATGMLWSQSRQREQEQELLFIGDQFRQAIEAYYQRTPGVSKRYPQRLEELLEDKRYPMVQRYLRKIYADPLTGKPEWGLMEAPGGGGIMGVHSLSNAAPIKKKGFGQKDRKLEGVSTYHEWQFFYEAPPVPPPAALPANPSAASGSQAPVSPRGATPAPTAPAARSR